MCIYAIFSLMVNIAAFRNASGVSATSCLARHSHAKAALARRLVRQSFSDGGSLVKAASPLGLFTHSIVPPIANRGEIKPNRAKSNLIRLTFLFFRNLSVFRRSAPNGWWLRLFSLVQRQTQIRCFQLQQPTPRCTSLHSVALIAPKKIVRPKRTNY